MTRSLEGIGLREAGRIRIEVEGDRIARVREAGGGGDGGPWLAPGLVDLQVNGCAGLDFNAADPDPAAVGAITRHLWRHGVTTYLPTVITACDRGIRRAVRAIAAGVAGDPMVAASVPGIHLEGPFISPQEGPRGAHDPRWVRPPDWDAFQRWQDAAGGLIRLVTLSPEWPGAARFVERCVDAGVLVAIGHTAATAEQIQDAVAAGARLSTHLGNGAHVLLPRHRNYLWEQMACDELWASLIADGVHLPTPVLRVMLRSKRERAVLVSDAVAATSLPPGDYELSVGGRVRLTADGRLTLAGNPDLLAGSVQLLPAAVAHLVREGLAAPADAWEMASTRPAGLIGLEAALRPGAPADVVAFEWRDGEIVPTRVVKAGTVVA